MRTYVFTWNNRSVLFYASSEEEATAQFKEQFNTGPDIDLKITLHS